MVQKFPAGQGAMEIWFYSFSSPEGDADIARATIVMIESYLLELAV